MYEWLQGWLNTSEFLPHGHCFLWTPRLLGLFITGESLTAIAYYAIPVTLWYFAKRRPDFPFRWVLWLFAAFILLCGTTHIIGLWNIWNTSYWLSGWVTLATGLVSIITGIAVLWLLPKVISLPSPDQLKQSVQLLQQHVLDLEQTRTQLEVSEHRFREFVEVAQEGIWVLDIAGITTFVNQSMAAMLGYRAEEMLGKHLFEFVEDAGQQQAMRNLERRRQGASDKYTTWFLRKDGERRCTLVSTAPLYDETRQVSGMLKVLTDITEQERTSAELEEMNALLEMKVAERTSELTASNDALRQEIQAREQAYLELRQSRQQLEASNAALKTQSDSITRLNEMVETLQTVANEEEVTVVLASYAQTLFQIDGVELLLQDEPHKRLRRAPGSGIAAEPGATYSSDDCWAFRKGRIHPARLEQDDIRCAHLGSLNDGRRAFCVPMVARGQVMGVLSLHGDKNATDILFDSDPSRLLEAFGEQASLSLANLHLRMRLYEESIRDPLTGLYNRRYLQEQLKLETARMERGNTDLSILMVDIDHFKRINDTFGHEIGDQALKQVATQLRQMMRQGDVLSRFGGEEFIMVLPGSPSEAAETRARAICAAVASAPLIMMDTTWTITVSIGVASAVKVVSSTELLTAADNAMYTAKHNGRNRVEIAPTLN